jgi:AcrR family transcriptional regulator
MPPPRSQNNPSPFNRKAQHDAKRVAILSEAARLFNGKGSRATTLQDVARGLGLTKTSLYYYVRTKEELIFQCYEAALQRQHAVMDELDATAALRWSAQRVFFAASLKRGCMHTTAKAYTSPLCSRSPRSNPITVR